MPIPRIRTSCTRQVLIIIFSILLHSVPLSLISGETVTTTFSDGSSEAILSFPASGSKTTVFMSLPYKASIRSASLTIEGLPEEKIDFLNHSTHDHFNSTFNDNVTLSDDSAVLSRWENWWNDTWYYALDVVVNTTGRNRTNLTVSLYINFTTWLRDLGVDASLDEDSIRVVEVDGDGIPVVHNASIAGDERYVVPHNLTKTPFFDVSSAAEVTLRWTMGGTRPNDTEAYFMVYFDTTRRPKAPPASDIKFFKDIVLANQAPPVQTSYLFLGKEDGFSQTPDISLPTRGPVKFVLEDIDMDGYMDVVMPNSGSSVVNSNDNSAVFFGGPEGPSETAGMLFPTIGTYAAAVADLNKDGLNDIVFANNHDGWDYTVDSYLFWGSAAGFNSTPDHMFNTTGAADIEVADFNDDGWPDVAFSNYFDGTHYDIDSVVFAGGATGFGTEPTYYLPTNGSFACDSADINGDSVPDLVLANYIDDTFYFQLDSHVYFGGSGGFASSPDLTIRGNGAFAIEAADIDGDGQMDFVVGNLYDGATGDIDSYVYYHNDTGVYTDPDVTLRTHDVYDIAVADVNNDGYTDIAFANSYFGGYDTDSWVYLGSSTGFSALDRLAFATHGASGVEVGELDSYRVDLDSDPVSIEVRSLLTVYLPSGTLTSQTIPVEDAIRSIVATWGADEPEGSRVTVLVSNDGGASWTETMQGVGTVFGQPGRDLAYRVELFTVNETPVLHWINLTYQMGNYPSNVTVDIGDDGTVDWAETDVLNYTAVLNSTAVAYAIEALTTPDRFYPWETVVIPVTVASATSGVVRVHSVNISHNSPPYVLGEVPEIAFDEDGTLLAHFDLDDIFADIDGDVIAYAVNGTDSVHVRITSENLVDLWADDDWSGQETAVFTADDGNGGNATVSIIVVVNPVNDPPVAFINVKQMGGPGSYEYTFDGLNSTDVDGTIGHYLWDLGDGTKATGPVVNHTFVQGGSDFRVVLTVIDDGGASDSDNVTVRTLNQPPIAMLDFLDDPSLGFDTNSNVVFVMAGTMDPDGSIDRFRLDFGDGEGVDRGGAPPLTWAHQFKDGTYTYTVTLSVWDEHDVMDFAEVQVTVHNRPPEIVTISAPTEAAVDERVSFSVVAKDSDGRVATYMWDFTGNGVFNWSSDVDGNATTKYKEPGTYRATLKVIDDDGLASFQTVTIKVKGTATAAADYGLAIGLGIALIVVAIILGYIVFQQRSVIMRQKGLLVRRDEALRELQLEQEEETVRRDRRPRRKRDEVTMDRDRADVVEEEEEDLGTLEPMDSEGPDATGIMRPDTTGKTIPPLAATGILRPAEEKPKPIVPPGLGDMMGAAQAQPAGPPVEGETGEVEEEGEEGDEVEEEDEVEERVPVAKARCPGCKSVIPLYSLERPMRLKCDKCGKEGVIR